MTAIARILARGGLPLFSLLVLTGCGTDDYLMQRLFVHSAGVYEWQGQSCSILSGRGSSGVGVTGESLEDDEFSVTTETRRNEATVTISTSQGSKTLTFDRRFLRSGKVSTTDFETGDGTEYRLEHWGGSDCEMGPIPDGLGGASM